MTAVENQRIDIVKFLLKYQNVDLNIYNTVFKYYYLISL